MTGGDPRHAVHGRYAHDKFWSGVVMLPVVVAGVAGVAAAGAVAYRWLRSPKRPNSKSSEANPGVDPDSPAATAPQHVQRIAIPSPPKSQPKVSRMKWLGLGAGLGVAGLAATSLIFKPPVFKLIASKLPVIGGLVKAPATGVGTVGKVTAGASAACVGAIAIGASGKRAPGETRKVEVDVSKAKCSAETVPGKR